MKTPDAGRPGMVPGGGLLISRPGMVNIYDFAQIVKPIAGSGMLSGATVAK